jgi:hypothetical protein
MGITRRFFFRMRSSLNSNEFKEIKTPMFAKEKCKALHRAGYYFSNFTRGITEEGRWTGLSWSSLRIVFVVRFPLAPPLPVVNGYQLGFWSSKPREICGVLMPTSAPPSTACRRNPFSIGARSLWLCTFAPRYGFEVPSKKFATCICRTCISTRTD